MSNAIAHWHADQSPDNLLVSVKSLGQNYFVPPKIIERIVGVAPIRMLSYFEIPDATERGSIEPHESLHLSLEALGLSRWWPILAADLATRFTDRATWSGSDALERLEAHIERIYAAAGVLLERNGDRVTFYLPAVA